MDYNNNDLDLLYYEHSNRIKKQVVLDDLYDKIGFGKGDIKVNENLKYGDIKVNEILKYGNIIGKDLKNNINDFDYLVYLKNTIQSIMKIYELVSNEENNINHLDYFYDYCIKVLSKKLNDESNEIIKEYLNIKIEELENKYEIEIDRKQYKKQISDIDREIYKIKLEYFIIPTKVDSVGNYKTAYDCYQKLKEYLEEIIKYESNVVISKYIESKINYYITLINDLEEKISCVYHNIYEEENYLDSIPKEKKYISIDENITNPLYEIVKEIYYNMERTQYLGEILENNFYKVTIGSKVKVLFLDDNELEEFTIYYDPYTWDYYKLCVDAEEIQYDPRMLSSRSKLGKALIDMKKGSVVNYETYGRIINVKIIDIC